MSDNREDLAHADGQPGRRWDVAVFAAAVAVAWLLRPSFLTDWDSFDYTVAAIQGQPSSLATGRMFFIAIHAAAWRIADGLFNVPVAEAWRVFSGLTLLLSGLTAVAVFRAGRWLTGSRAAAVLGAALWLTSPQAMVYASAVMTETPTILFLCLAIIATERWARSDARPYRLIAASAAAFAVAVNMREPLVCMSVYFVGRILLPGKDVGADTGGSRLAGTSATLQTGATRRAGVGRRIKAVAVWAVVAAIVTACGFLLAAGRLEGGIGEFVGNFHKWYGQMAEERGEYPNLVSVNGRYILMFSLAVSLPGVVWLAISLPALVARLLRGKTDPTAIRLGPLAWLMAGNAAYLLSLLGNHDMQVNPRFDLPLMLPVMLLNAAMLADALRRRSRGAGTLAAFLAAAVVGLLLIALAQTEAGTSRVFKFLGLNGLNLPEGFHESSMSATLLLGLVGLIGAVAGVLLLKLAAGWRLAGRTAAATACIAMFFLGLLAIGWNWLDYQHYAQSRWLRYFVEQSAKLPDDAMLIPSAGTPAVQYLINGGFRRGWIVTEDCRADDIRARCNGGWILVPSGWCWPDGTNGKPALLDLVEAHLAGGKPVYVFAGASKWRPNAARNIEWPQIEQLQKAHAIEADGPADMCRVLPEPPQPGELVPLGMRKSRHGKQAVIQ